MIKNLIKIIKNQSAVSADAFLFSAGMAGNQSGIIGLDINGASVKAIHLTRQGRQLKVEDYAIVLKEQNDWPSALHKALSLLEKPSKNVMVAIPTSMAISKTIQVDPNLCENEIADYIDLEIERFVPFPSEEISWDFQPLILKANKKEVLFVACRKELIESIENVVVGLKFKLQIVDVEMFAIERALKNTIRQLAINADAQQFAVINININGFTLLIQVAEQTVFTHSEEIGQVNSLQFALQIQRALQLFLTKHPQQLQFIYLLGEFDRIPDLVPQLQAVLAIKIILSNPFSTTEFAAEIDRQEFIKIAAQLFVCYGVALRGLQL